MGDPRVNPFKDTLTRAQRRDLLREMFPTVEVLVDDDDNTIAWVHATRRWVRGPNTSGDEIEVLAWILQDIFRHDQAVAGRSGPKPSTLEPVRVFELLRQFSGQDHTTLDFHHAFALLCGNRSLRHVGALTGMSKDKVRRLLNGRSPTVPEMEAAAKGFRKHPSFFREFRAQHLGAELQRHLTELPEASIDMYKQATKGRNQ